MLGNSSQQAPLSQLEFGDGRDGPVVKLTLAQVVSPPNEDVRDALLKVQHAWRTFQAQQSDSGSPEHDCDDNTNSLFFGQIV